MRIPGLTRLRDAYEAVLIDLDGTLLDGRSQLTERTRRAVRSLVDHDFLVVLCTGRSVAGTRPTWRALGLESAIVAYNGAWIGPPDGPPERYIPIPDAHVQALLRQEREAAFAFRHHREAKYTVMTRHPDHEPVARWFENVVRAARPGDLPTFDLMRLSLFFCEQALPPGEVQDVLRARLPEATRQAVRTECFPLRIFPPYRTSSLHLFEVQGGSRGKAEAYAWLRERHGVPAERTIAVGDQRNDLGMLAGAGLAVAPANAIPQAKAHAHVLVGHNAEEGLAAWIEDGAPTDGARDREPAA